jgi:hypothetical protein
MEMRQKTGAVQDAGALVMAPEFDEASEAT